MDKVLSDKKAIMFFLFPALIFFILIVFLPIFISGYYSTLDWDGLKNPVFVGLQNYKELFANTTGGFTLSIKNSLYFVLVSVFIQLPISLFLALVLANGVKGEKFFLNVYFIPVIISTVVIGQLWMKIYNPDYGLLNSFLKSIGLGNMAKAWLADPTTALGASFVPTLWQYVGYHMLLMYAAIKSIPTDIYEAAKLDGASGIQMAFRITIPLIKPMLKVCVTFSVIGALKIFDLVYVLTNGGPNHASEVPSTLLVNNIFVRSMYGYGSAIAIFIIIECLVFTGIIQKFFKTDDVE
ncbi:raffinose/stachyose/melibiose transport system permease protein [Clostridium saccharoperbutylacetonicum]|uniref:Permease component of ABC-type sugar transporter n=1 Tax=Clostridium saccharoperbutylacetonicum N1-4(HMT) TaxID=931276 RepID=M1LZA0_9CLOT|nr:MULTISPECIES: sugar ABC transporter permease [Clostridium]AGF58620.1 permease component of ABC-type sugar transporter [Clostridium saccharoperbutylacetonicum N1-4(HMT)]NRT60601.1 raffinose/stachyose/melibiose transport system permease protein [Clostridium saccharoperbutylacetonicum]NSB23915.1 raffinose/stachyose/melibiose transport system permease protein [Clostridium saccharoperbutylacetonicum]NSB43291.1 raffinose/stachyose/melibiose transport system permease protein [Clostridium saccharope